MAKTTMTTSVLGRKVLRGSTRDWFGAPYAGTEWLQPVQTPECTIIAAWVEDGFVKVQVEAPDGASHAYFLQSLKLVPLEVKP